MAPKSWCSKMLHIFCVCGHAILEPIIRQKCHIKITLPHKNELNTPYAIAILKERICVAFVYDIKGHVSSLWWYGHLSDNKGQHPVYTTALLFLWCWMVWDSLRQKSKKQRHDSVITSSTWHPLKKKINIPLDISTKRKTNNYTRNAKYKYK